MIVWIDIENTDANCHPRDSHLLEVALVVTDDELVEVGHMTEMVNPVGVSVDDMQMPDIVRQMHTDNGLLADLRAGKGERRHIAEGQLVGFLRYMVVSSGDWVGDPTKSVEERLRATPLAGSTVGFDRAVLREHMPEFIGLLSYRNIDVSSVTELAKRWAPEVYRGRPGQGKAAHRALADIRGSIDTLRYYRASGFLDGLPAPHLAPKTKE